MNLRITTKVTINSSSGCEILYSDTATAPCILMCVYLPLAYLDVFSISRIRLIAQSVFKRHFLLLGANTEMRTKFISTVYVIQRIRFACELFNINICSRTLAHDQEVAATSSFIRPPWRLCPLPYSLCVASSTLLALF